MVVLLPGDLPGADQNLLNLFRDKPVFIARLEAAAAPPPGPQLGFAGIAKPWKVERALTAAGCELIDFAAFPDHAAFSDGDLKALAARAADQGAGLVTTEKDWVRLPPDSRGRDTDFPVRARFEEEENFLRLLTSSSRRKTQSESSE